jgi:hypothetical protein
MKSNRDPVQGLVDYIIDIKPFHTKIMDVLVEYVYTDHIEVAFDDRIEFNVELIFDAGSSEELCDNDTGGFDLSGWGLINDPLNSDPFTIPGNPTSPYRTYNDGFVAGLPNGSDIVQSHYDLLSLEPCELVGPRSIFVVFGEELEFVQGTDIVLNDLLSARIGDMDGNWDSRLIAHHIKFIDAAAKTITVVGNHLGDRNGVAVPQNLGYPGHQIAIHGTVNNDGIYTAVFSTYDPVEHYTVIQVVESLSAPQAFSGAYIGRAVSSESIYYDPTIGYITPTIYSSSQYTIGGSGLDSVAGLSQLGTNKIGARISNSILFTADPSTDTFTANVPLTHSTGDLVYLTSDGGTLPIIKFVTSGQEFELMQYQPYHFIRISSTRFQLSITAAYPAFEIISEDGHDFFVGVGEQISFMELAIDHQDDNLVDIPENITISNELVFHPTNLIIVDIDSNDFVVTGDHTQHFFPGALITIQDSAGGTNDGQWTLTSISYDVVLDQTALTVAGPPPSTTLPYGALVDYVGRDETVASATFQDRISFHVESLVLSDMLAVTMSDDSTQFNITYGVPTFIGSFGVPYFGVGGFGGYD